MFGLSVGVKQPVSHVRRRLAARGFVSGDDDETAAVATCESAAYQWDASLLGPLCPLMGRKFNAATAGTVIRLLTQARENPQS